MTEAQKLTAEIIMAGWVTEDHTRGYSFRRYGGASPASFAAFERRQWVILDWNPAGVSKYVLTKTGQAAYRETVKGTKRK